MFWTDLGKSAAIERAGMDGSQRKVIVGHNTTWPNGLAIDHLDDRLYWVDAGTHALESCSLEGKDRKVSVVTRRNRYSIVSGHFHMVGTQTIIFD